MAESLGARLRERRKQRQISLVDISERTKIKISLLEALERDDVSHWPTGIFRRAFIRAYAVAIDLEPDPIVKEFLELFPDPAESMVPVPAVEPGSEHLRRPAPPMRVRFLVRSAIDSVTRAWGDFSKKPEAVFDAQPHAAGETADARIFADVPVRTPVQARVHADTALGAPAQTDVRPEARAEVHVIEQTPDDAKRLLSRAANQLDAVGLVVWTWDSDSSELVPTFVHGYSNQLVAQLPTVRRDADNATAAAFRSAQTCVVRGGDGANGALVVPLMTASGCVGVFAVELARGDEQRETVRELTSSLAAQFADVLGAPLLRPAVGT
jgi:transcriptional regulator with XRE-family HTH domain